MLDYVVLRTFSKVRVDKGNLCVVALLKKCKGNTLSAHQIENDAEYLV